MKLSLTLSPALFFAFLLIGQVSSQETCPDSPLPFKKFPGKKLDKDGNSKIKFKDCEWVGSALKQNCRFLRRRLQCPETCKAEFPNSIEEENLCELDAVGRFKLTDFKNKAKTCNWVGNAKTEKKLIKRCNKTGVRETCRKTCKDVALEYVK
jgi:hypothetical protein